MNKKKIAASAAIAAAASAGVLAPSVAQSALSENSNPSCAAVWAHLNNDGVVPGPLGQGNKFVGKGFAKLVAQSKTDGYCGGV